MSALIQRYSAIRKDTLNRFYTRLSVGELLAQCVKEINPLKVLDLGAGQGSLSASVAKLWPNAKFLTVDIDIGCIASLKESIMEAGANNHEHRIEDVFDSKLPKKITSIEDIDLAVCNPPFFKPRWRQDFIDILEEANLLDAYHSISDISAELIFLAQNLRLVKSGGMIAMIAPDGMITGKKSEPFRKSLIEKFSVECVLQLPPHSFHDTEARCFILILKKNKPINNKIKIQRFDIGIGLSDPIHINTRDAINRLDYDFHTSRNYKEGESTTLRQLGAEIKRGSFSTAEAKKSIHPVFHTSDFMDDEIAIGSDRKIIFPQKKVIASPGDILMARVDRRLHQKVAIVSSGDAAITDCVYRVRLPENIRMAVFYALRSPDGEAKLLATSKGVGARLLGKADLLDMPFTI